MKQFYFVLLLFISLTAFSQEKGYVFQSRGVPSNSEITTDYLQPDGSSLTIRMNGDAVINWATTIDDYTLLMNENSGFEYAEVSDNGDLILSGILAKNPKKRSESDNKFLIGIEKNSMYSKSQITIKENNHIFFIQKGNPPKAFPTTGNRKLLLILANFSNTSTTYTQAQYNNIMNQVNYNGTGSFKDYYLENSYGQLTITTTVTAWVTLPNTHNYYGPDTQWGEFAFDAVTAANSSVDYSQYDNDGDGTVDGVAIIHQGPGQEETSNTNDIWSHSWDLASAGYSSAQRTFDGVEVESYTTMPETSGGAIMTIGVMCHEFGHNLGSPDYYDTDYSTGGSYDGTGDWDVMAGGSYNGSPSGAKPAHHNAYTKIYYYNWATATLLSTAQNVTLNNAAQNSTSFYRYNTTTSNEFFLLENRQQVGFDASLPGHGLIIYHADGTYISAHDGSNDINAGSHQGMYPMAANSTTASGIMTGSGAVSTSGCPWPGTSSKTTFTDATTPNSKSWAAANTAKPLINIAENTGVITLCFMSCASPDDPQTFTATAASSSQINLAWTKNASNNNVMVAYNTTNTFGTPTNGTTYIAGNTISGSGTVIYNGSLTAFNHTTLNPNTTYYYRAWSVLTGNAYSPGVTANATTLCGAITSFPWNEGFENGGIIPNCWSQAYVSGDDVNWTYVTTNGTSPASAHGGSYFGVFKDTDTGSDRTKLITPSLNLGSFSSATLSFWYYQKVWTPDQDELRVYYKTSSAGAWTQITGAAYTSSITTWTQVTLTLPSISTDYYIAFEGDAKYGYGTCIDDINVTGTLSCTPPTTQANTFSATSIGENQMTVNWLRGNGTGGVIVVAKAGSAVNADPSSGSTYTANATFGSGNQIGTGNYVVYSGTGTNVIVTGLTASTTYHYAIYEYNTSGTCYHLTELTGNATTNASACTPPTTQANSFSATAIVANQMTANWVRGNGTAGVIVVARAGSAVNADPVSGTTYTANAAFGSGNQIGTGNYVVYSGTGTNVVVTGLTASTTYHYAIYEYNTSGTCYNLTELTGNATTSASSCTLNLPFTEGFEAVTFPPTCWTSFRGTNGLGLTQDWERLLGGNISTVACAYVEYENVTGGLAEDWLVSPQLVIPASGAPVLTYYEKQSYASDYGTNYYIKISTTSQTSIVSFTDILSYDETGLTTAWAQKSVDLSAYKGQNIYIAFVMTNDDGDNWFIDDINVSVSTIPTISFNPTELQFGSILVGQNSTSQSFTLTGSNLTQLVAITPATHYQISTDNTNFSTSPINVTPVSGEISQTLYVRLSPTNDNVPKYSGIFFSSSELTTQYVLVEGAGVKFIEPRNLDAVAGTNYVDLSWETPFDEGFEGTWPPTGWLIQYNTAANGGLNGNGLISPTGATWSQIDVASFGTDHPEYIYTGTYSAGLGYDAPDFNWLISPDVKIQAGEYLNFWIWYNSSLVDGWITKFYVLVNSGGTWTTLNTMNSEASNNTYQQKVSVNLSAYSGQTVKIAFVYEYNDGFQLLIDDVKISKTAKSSENNIFEGISMNSKREAKISENDSFKSTNIISGCKVYEGTNLIQTITNPLTLTYSHTGLSCGSYSYTVKTTYSTPVGDSEASNIATANLPAPAQPSTITGSTTPCQTTSQTYSVTNVAGVTYTWVFPSSWSQTGGGTTNSVTVTVGSGSGNITVTPSLACGNGTARTLAVTPTTVPAQPSTITGSTTPCQTTSQTYSVTNVAGVTYTWTFPTGWSQTGGGTTNSITVTVGSGTGNITVTPSNGCGNGTSQTLAVTPSTVPVQPSTITGSATPCQTTSQTYSVTNVAGVTYTWTFPSGWSQTGGGTTNSVTVTVGSGTGNITVTPSNGCGTGTAQTLAVTTSTVPTQPSIITGSTTPCQATSQTYSVTNVTGVTYTWAFPTGWSQTGGGTTNSVTVTVGSGTGNITVTPSNGCGDGTAQTLGVVPANVPSQPSVITGQAGICGDLVSLLYSVTNVSGVTYTWGLPSGWTGSSTSNSITVNPNLNSGTVTVTPSNSCGSGTAITLAVTVNDLPSVNAGSDFDIPTGTSTTIDATISGVGPFTYSWIPTGSLLNAAVEDPTTVNLTSTTTFTLDLLDQGTGCSNSDDITITVTGGPLSVNPTATPATICAGATSQLMAGAGGGSGTYSYTWTSNPSGFSSSDSNPNVNPSVTTIYNVVVNDGFNTVNENITVNVNPIPDVTINASDTEICIGEGVTLSGQGATSYTWDNGITDASEFFPTSIQTYTVTGTDLNLCQNTANIQVIVNSLPVVTINATDIEVCSGSGVTLSGEGAVSYIWDNSVNDGIEFYPTSTITYNVTGTDANLCQNTANIEIVVNDLPDIYAGDDQSIPYSTSTTIDASVYSLGAYDYSWEPAAMLINATIEDPTTVNLTLNTLFTLTVENQATLCLNSDQVAISIIGDELSASISATPSTICAGEQVQLEVIASNGTGSYTYSWTSDPSGFISDISNPVVYPTENTTYYVDINDGVSTVSENVIVVVNALPTVSLALFDDICINEPAFGLTGGLPTGGTYSGTGVNANQFDANIAGIGTQTITYTYNDGTCSNSATSDITVIDLPIVGFTYVANNLQVTFTNTTTNATNYLWDFGDLSGTSTEVNPVYTYSVAGNYNVLLTAENDVCTDIYEETLNVENVSIVELNSNTKLLVYPNPNDGVFNVKFITDNYINVTLEIYTMDGKLIYQHGLKNVTNGVERTIDISRYSSGVYQLNVYFNDEIIKQNIIIK